MRRLIMLLAASVVLSACSPEPSEQVVENVDSEPGAASPIEAVSGLLAALDEGDFDGAAALTVPNQAVAVGASEGLSVPELAVVSASDDAASVARFWESFAVDLSALIQAPIADIEIVGEAEVADVDGVAFAWVGIDLPAIAGDEPTFAVRSGDGWKIDLVASFPAVLATRLPDVVAAARGSVDGDVVLSELNALRPSLEAALQEPGLPSSTGTIIRNAIVSFES